MESYFIYNVRICLYSVLLSFVIICLMCNSQLLCENLCCYIMQESIYLDFLHYLLCYYVAPYWSCLLEFTYLYYALCIPSSLLQPVCERMGVHLFPSLGHHLSEFLCFTFVHFPAFFLYSRLGLQSLIIIVLDLPIVGLTPTNW